MMRLNSISSDRVYKEQGRRQNREQSKVCRIQEGIVRRNGHERLADQNNASRFQKHQMPIQYDYFLAQFMILDSNKFFGLVLFEFENMFSLYK